jgi:hypothetical protein
LTNLPFVCFASSNARWTKCPMPFLCSSSMAYVRSYWKRRPWENIDKL